MTTPKVFISYSHDSEEHKAWVADLATRRPWVSTVFGNAMDYQSTLLGYYIALNTLEFLEFLAAGRLVPDDPAQFALRHRPCL
jgi:hypothetical protein